MGTPRSERTGAPAPRGRFETVCWFVAASVSAVGLIGGVAAAGTSELFAATVCAVNLVALADRALHRRFSWLVWTWSLVVALASPLALVSAILLCDSLVAGAEAAWISGLDRILLLVAIGFPASFVGLRGRDAFRPAWWHALLFLVPFLGFSVLLASRRALRWFGELLHGPRPDDFMRAMEWHHEVDDSIEGVVAWTLVIWVAFFLAGAIRGAIVSRPSEPPPPTRLGPLDAVSGSAPRTRVGVVAWWIALVLAVLAATTAMLVCASAAFGAESVGTAIMSMLVLAFWGPLAVALWIARGRDGFHWLRYLWSLFVVAALPVAALGLLGLVRAAAGVSSLDAPEWIAVVWTGIGLPAAAVGLRVGDAFRPSLRQSAVLLPLFGAGVLLIMSPELTAWVDELRYGVRPEGVFRWHGDRSNTVGIAVGWCGALWLTYFLLGTGRSIVLRRPVEDPSFATGLAARASGRVEPKGT